MIRFLVLFLFLQSCFITKSHSISIVRRLPGYAGDLPFKLETSYVRTGEKEDIQLFYYFVKSTRNPKEDPIIFHFPGGPGASGILSLISGIGPLSMNTGNLTLTVNPYAWTQIANVIFVDAPAGAGFSYAETEEGWISSDTMLSTLSVDFIKKFLSNNPKFLKNPVYISGISYSGIVVPKVTLDLYEGNEREDQPIVNVQGYILNSPLTNKFTDFNSRLEFAHRLALISDEVHQSAIDNCHGNYVDKESANLACRNSLQSYEECTRRINLENILEPYCDESDPTLDCELYAYIEALVLDPNFSPTLVNSMTKYIFYGFRLYDITLILSLNKWVNMEAVQQAFDTNQVVGQVEMINYTLHYLQGKNDTNCYTYDIFSSFSYHKKLLSKNCRALILSGDHDAIFPYVGVKKWITSLNIEVEAPWKPFYADHDTVGGYVTKYTQKNYSLTFATVKGGGHSVARYKPKESFVLMHGWFSSQTYYSSEVENHIKLY